VLSAWNSVKAVRFGSVTLRPPRSIHDSRPSKTKDHFVVEADRLEPGLQPRVQRYFVQEDGLRRDVPQRIKDRQGSDEGGVAPLLPRCPPAGGLDCARDQRGPLRCREAQRGRGRGARRCGRRLRVLAGSRPAQRD